MPLLNDNELDRLSREAADQYDADQGTSGWEALERRLDEELPQPRRKRFMLWWWMAGLLLLGGALWGILKWNDVKNGDEMITVKRENITDRNNRNKDTNENTGKEEKVNGSGTIVTRGNGAQRTQEVPAISKAQRTQKVSAINKSFRIQDAKTVNKNGRSQNTTANNRPLPNHPDNKQSDNTPPPAPDQQSSASSGPRQQKAPTKPSETPYISTKQDVQHPDSATSVYPAQKSSNQNSPAVPDNQPTPQTSIADSIAQPANTKITQITTKLQPLTPSSRKHTLYATVTGGADFSNVKFSSTGRTGFNAGLQVGYYFTDRLSLNTGITYNKKNYKARGKDFTPKGPMIYYDINKIEGACSMLDIPLNIRYDLNIKTRSRYFISAGISSYLMNKEDYDYYYYNNAGNYSSRNWKTDENSNYLFSILNFSAGVEKQIGGNFYFQAEPYLKVPVRGVGNGNIQLNSFGLNLGLKYQFGKPIKK